MWEVFLAPGTQQTNKTDKKIPHLMKLTFLIGDVFVDVLFYTTGQMAS